jgi:hypothetical protein
MAVTELRGFEASQAYRKLVTPQEYKIGFQRPVFIREQMPKKG